MFLLPVLYFILDRKIWYISKRKIQSPHDSILLLCACQHCYLCDASFDWNVLGCFRSDLSSMPNSIGKKEEINAKEESSGVGNTGDSIWRSENDADRYGYAVR